MCKPTFLNIIIYLLLTSITFYVLMMFKNQDYRLIEMDNLLRGYSFIYFAFVMMPLPFFSIILFSLPIYYSFKIKNSVYWGLLMIAILIGKYLFYIFMTSRILYDLNGIYYLLINFIYLILFFSSEMKLILKKG